MKKNNYLVQYMPTQSAKSKMSLENRLVTAKGEGGGGRMEKKARVSRCKIIYIYRERENWMEKQQGPTA